ncbi:N-acetylmuramoyl-L-alanine amidase [Dysgonomonas sp. 25]|uniref:N-acetylmuramoyl-L-alanine amidase n=1 Tax=Dysgonomonas sp. 25 TaxID=2302933 RepID=UPI0013D8CC1A|nr:N-acetylmuramoyl-L-alanine amidase [Dysgonomonas sp. 25]NDV69009.1 N-acetylmuramoyl-L-alanine amidase [Dysgonomonas sp. 25]
MRTLFCLFLLSVICFSLSAQNKKDIPKKGEGLNAFLKRNGCTTAECYNQFLELNKSKLGKNNTLLKGVSYEFPSISTSTVVTSTASVNTSVGATRKNKLFGSKYEEYTIKSDRLKGACFFLSSGHGGPDPGAIGKADGKSLHEDEYAYDITLRLALKLLQEGATVHMIIQDANDGIRDGKYLTNSKTETCMGDAIPLNQVDRLKQRVIKVNTLNKSAKEKYKRAVFIHLDSRSKKQQLDVFFYHAKNSSKGEKLAKTMKETFRSHYDKHQPNRGFTGTVSPRNLYVLTNTAPVALFAELGNIQNKFDQRRFLQSNNREALANWMCRGFIADYENWKKEQK